MRAHADRADARPAAAVRDAERLVQVQVRHVGAELARLREADERVEVRAVEVHLAAVLVHDLADLADRVLEHAVRRRVGDHQRAEPCSRCSSPWLEVVEVDVAVVVARDDDDVDAGHDRARRVGAVRRRRDEAHGALEVAAAAVVRADREQPRVLALRARVRLQRHRVVAGDLAQPLLEIGEQLRGSRAPGRAGANGWIDANSGHVIGTISVVALSFIVHEPSGIIVRSSARSRSARCRRYRSIAVSERCGWNDRVRQVRRRARECRPGSRRRPRPGARLDAERAEHRVDGDRRWSSRRARCRRGRRRRARRLTPRAERGGDDRVGPTRPSAP